MTGRHLLPLAGIAAIIAGVALMGARPTSRATAPCKVDGTGLFVAPDRSDGCTPGEWITDPDLSTAHVCHKGYNPRPPESVTGPLKTQTMNLYGVPASDSASVESDHLYPVWLGGATSIRNLWPEPNYPQ